MLAESSVANERAKSRRALEKKWSVRRKRTAKSNKKKTIPLERDDLNYALFAGVHLLHTGHTAHLLMQHRHFTNHAPMCVLFFLPAAMPFARHSEIL